MARTTCHLVQAWNHGDVDYLNKTQCLSSSEQMSVVSQELTWDTPRPPPPDQNLTAFMNKASHLQSRLRLSLHTNSLNNGANVRPVNEKIWRSDGGHRAPVQGAAQGISNSRTGITRGPHLHFTLTTRVETAHIHSCQHRCLPHQICL